VARILVADPDEYACETIALCLERSGHEVLRAEHGDAAMAVIMQKSPHLVLTEIMLPMRSGFEILSSLNGLGLAASIPVIFVTAAASQREMDRALAEGISDYVVKPFHLRELALRTNLALARREAALAGAGRAEPGRESLHPSGLSIIAA
jgi:DNA-binding response OmpR family regulator